MTTHLRSVRTSGAPSRRLKSAIALACAALLSVMALTSCAPPSLSSQASSNAKPASGQPTPAAQFTYVALAASDGYGIGTAIPFRDNWPMVLSGDLGRPVHLMNLGIPGATVQQAIKDEVPVALDAHPDLVTIWLAANDFADGVPLATYKSQLATLLRDLRRGTQAPIFVGNLPDLALLPAFGGTDATVLRSRVQAWNAAITAICMAQSANVVDLYGGWSELAQHPEYIASDGFHPSTAGARRLAQIFSAAIRARNAA